MNSRSGDSVGYAFFPNAARYAQLRAGAGLTVRERNRLDYPFPYSERHLQCAWFDSVYRPEGLETDCGEPVKVVDPGRWNLEAGPDFLDATLIVGPERRMLIGDVEVHVHPADWNAHGHAGDPRYSRVIAHVTYAPHSEPIGDSIPPGSVRIPLREALRSNPAFSFENIDVAAYPYGAATDRPPCAEALAPWGPDKRAELLECAGEERLRVKAARMKSALQEAGASQVLYEEVMVALGYKHNRMQFRRLARIVTADRLREEADGNTLKGYALLLGVAGLLPKDNPSRSDRETASFVRSLWDHWWKLQSGWQPGVMVRAEWRLSGIRPQNHPARRLAAAASMFADGSELPAYLLPAKETVAEWFSLVAAPFRECSGVEYWRYRLSMGGKRQKKPTALLGDARIGAILNNVIIPFTAAAGGDTSALLPHLPPEQDNSLIRETAHKLFGRDHNPALHRNGLRQQGLLQVFHDFCLVNRSACRDCPLPTALDSAWRGFVSNAQRPVQKDEESGTVKSPMKNENCEG